ncbi:putative methyltransferase-domain-containing protein [Thamnocephalis sphaerospora]|uniref:Putative methyltransferase-domain-containing protein n=1 Tax=Thamnocephalis sphaerospora TaxID=78915 RepID=A0A4P9XS13_9FUNG|nr:putative methyltransferase-domain-containing protein [Thamnocephalis sphaerospora]|eukprot:RKP08895.1 putative methyltransferase-domain-containing protein [Thamnocephalis sphaerospora]
MDFRPPSPEPTFVTHTRSEQLVQSDACATLRLRLVGAHPLWGHHLWNAARVFADYLDTRRETLCRERRVLELGAGAGLPGLVAALDDAKRVVLTDYPDADLLENLSINAQANAPDALASGRLCVKGYLWGADVEQLGTDDPTVPAGSFDLIILSDLIFNHSQHRAMLRTVRELPADTALPPLVTRETSAPQALVFFTHHRPWLAARDLRFFTLAASDSKQYGGFCVERVLEQRMQPMFAEDPGAETVRATVHGYRLTLRE